MMRKQAAFTLLELLVVLAIAAGLAALVAPQLARFASLVELKAAARETAAALRGARGRAIASGRETALALGTRLPRHPGIALELVVAHSEVLGAGTGASRFYPDGSSSGGRVRLTLEGHGGSEAQVVDVDWLTGRIVVRRGAG